MEIENKLGRRVGDEIERLNIGVSVYQKLGTELVYLANPIDL